MTIRNNSLTKLIPLLTVVAIAGCSTAGSLFTPDKIDYKSASEKKVEPKLDVPPDLSQISRDNRYSIPENGSTGPLTASGFNASRTAGAANIPAAVTSTSVALNSWQNMHIERDGSQRWLVVPQNADVLFPKIKDFWQENGFLINEETPAAGVMETDWAENRAKIPQDFLRKTIGYVFDSLYSTGERDKFRTRLERREDGSTEVYISHRGVEEVLTGSDKTGSTWAARPNDPGLEVAFLSRLMVRLGATEEKAKEIVAGTVVLPVKAKFVKVGSTASIDVEESFDRAWRRIGLALDRVNFTVEDRDRAQGIYFVRYIDQDSASSSQGFFAKIFSSDKEKDTKRYRILVKGEQNLTHVTIQNNDGTPENSTASEKILNLLLEQLK